MPWRYRTDLLQALAAAQGDGDVLAIHMPSLFAMLGRRPAAAESAAFHTQTERAIARRAGAVAVIPIVGPISNRANLLEFFGFGASTTTISARFAAALRDPDIKAIVLDIDSPGGTIPGVDSLADEIFAARGQKPVIAQVNGVAASAAYWIAASADEIVAAEASYTGSIGVFSLHMDMSAALQEAGINISVVASTDDKVEELPFRPLSDEARQNLQDRVDHFDRLFTATVARGRGVPAAQIRAAEGRGRVFAGSQALERDLIDKIRPLSGTLVALGIDPSALTADGASGSASAARRRREIGLMQT